MNTKIKRIFYIFFLISAVTFAMSSKYKVNYSNSSSGRLDINMATKSQMLNAGVAQSYVYKILEFRDSVGRISKIEDLDRVNGIGKSTCNKLKKYFLIDKLPEYKLLHINSATDDTLKYYGLSKKQIKILREYLEKNDLILDNRGIKKILTKEQYEKYKDIIRYN